MGGDSSSHVWHVRVTLSERNTLAKIQAFCKEHLYVKLACKESADEEVARDHTHIACVSLEKALVRSTVLAHLRKHLEIKGNEDYSMTAPKPGHTLSGLYDYICKGTDPNFEVGAPQIIHNLFNLINVQQHHENYWLMFAELEAKTKAQYKKAEMDGRKVKKAVIAKLSEKYKEDPATAETLDKIVADILTEYKGDINDQSLFTTLQAVSWTIDGDTTAERAAARMRNRIWVKISKHIV